MKPNTIGRIFWIVQFIDICISSRILTTVDSCPCHPPSECLNTSEISYNIRQVLILPCESEDVVRCCSIVSKPIESADTSGSLQDQENKLEGNDGADVLSLNHGSFPYPLRYGHQEQKSVEHEEPVTRQRDQFATPEVSTQDDREESYNQVLIDRATSFESRRTSPRQPVSF
ncbi:uncharacterized protein LOC122398148 [Colletes gigas]|uniref:uncharacterized protein LOC122398148 n=1 Tax=Colletes gigas TaxID=935657 RepID=UPI001C9B1A96|nr:uncharacterized protein LOC122398148 [Colletes gigas]